MPLSRLIAILVLVIVAAGLTVVVAELVGGLAFLGLGALLVVYLLRRG